MVNPYPLGSPPPETQEQAPPPSFARGLVDPTSSRGHRRWTWSPFSCGEDGERLATVGGNVLKMYQKVLLLYVFDENFTVFVEMFQIVSVYVYMYMYLDICSHATFAIYIYIYILIYHLYTVIYIYIFMISNSLFLKNQVLILRFSSFESGRWFFGRLNLASWDKGDELPWYLGISQGGPLPVINGVISISFYIPCIWPYKWVTGVISPYL